ncbi:MAG: fibrobacter succinogenes major paralogous domain-containing protein [Bacteroidota bacterium]|jgi:uncharacterized protein (TIGR02145 family)
MKKMWMSLLIGITSIFVFTNSCKKDNNISTPVSINGIYFNPNLTYGTLKDIDSNVYRTIKIGTQTWMAENLKVTKYRNGDTIPKVTKDSVWRYLTIGACCSYNNDNSNIATYGRLYNHYTIVDPRNVCPVGWHVPRYTEWDTLVACLGSNPGTKLKETGNSHWYHSGGTNESGFTALPSGCRDIEGPFNSSTLLGEFISYELVDFELLYFNGSANSYDMFGNDNVGYSVRCVKD